MLPSLFTYIPSRRDKLHPRLDPAYVREVSQLRPMSFESPNARSKSITIADGPNTGGVRYVLIPKSATFSPIFWRPGNANARLLQALNRHPSHATAFQVGVAEDKGTRRTMEDAHSFVVDFDNIRGQGYFGLFDGHAGKHAAEWCGEHFHEVSRFFYIHQRLWRDIVAVILVVGTVANLRIGLASNWLKRSMSQ
jgi:hypothetical protein